MKDFEAALKALPTAVAEMKALNARVDLNRGIVELTAAEVAARPHLIWNAFIAVIGSTLPYDRMTDLQRVAHLAFRYDGEVQNGGHLQFFLNTRAGGHDFVNALEELSLPAQAELLQTAYHRWTREPRSEPSTSEEFVALAVLEEFGDVDAAYHQLRPAITDALRTCLERQQEAFVRVS